MKDRVFVDTNVFVYTQSSVEPQKRSVSLKVLEQYDCCISTQILSEISNVMIKKLKMRIDEVRQVLAAVNAKCSVITIRYTTIQKALNLKERYEHSFYDSLVLASALESDCQKTFLKMASGLLLNGKTLWV